MALEFSLYGLRTRRVIDLLREKFPEVQAWMYDPSGRHWCSSEGWYVYRCTGLNDLLGHYRRSDTLEIVDL